VNRQLHHATGPSLADYADGALRSALTLAGASAAVGGLAAVAGPGEVIKSIVEEVTGVPVLGPSDVEALAKLGKTAVQRVFGELDGHALARVTGGSADGIANPIPERLARVIPGDINPTTLGRPNDPDVFVTAAEDIAGLTPAQVAEKLTISPSKSFTIIEFDTPLEGLASPVLRSNPGFVGGGRTAGDAREFVIRNGPIPSGSEIRKIGR
jgi:hypothetical protein